MPCFCPKAKEIRALCKPSFYVSIQDDLNLFQDIRHWVLHCSLEFFNRSKSAVESGSITSMYSCLDQAFVSYHQCHKLLNRNSVIWRIINIWMCLGNNDYTVRVMTSPTRHFSKWLTNPMAIFIDSYCRLGRNDTYTTIEAFSADAWNPTIYTHP